jgi:hypothetical protein
MKSSNQIKIEFLTDLKELLAKYKGNNYSCEITAEDHFSGYAECGEDIKMTVTIPSIYEENGNQLREWIELDLGRYIDIDKINKILETLKP